MNDTNEYLILVINPGSTSTKIGIYRNEECILSEEISHSSRELQAYPDIMSQQEFREELILRALEGAGFKITDINCIIARGGALRPLPIKFISVRDKCQLGNASAQQ